MYPLDSRCRLHYNAFMVAAIRKILTVTPQGTLEIRSPELEPGTQAEVIVLLGTTPTDSAKQTPPTLQAWEALQRELALDPQATQKWIAQAQTERRSFGRGS